MNEGSPAVTRPIAPFTYDDIDGVADWRARLYWPTAQREMFAIGAQVPEQVIACAAERSDDVERQIICVAGGLFANGFMSLLEAAWMAQGCEELGIEPRGGPPEMPLILNGSEDFTIQEYRGPFSVKDVPMAPLKAVARVASWSRIDRLPVALLAPEATALTHNRLMVDAIDGHAINYRHAAAIVIRARREHGGGAAPDVTALVDTVLDRLLPLCPALNEVHRGRLRRAYRGRLVNAVGRAAADIVALRKTKLPKHTWSGTNGAYPTRLVAAEVRRRGGTVDVFDHGGVTAISQLPGSTALIELCTSSHFHVGTPRWAELLAKSESPRIASPLNRSTIVGQRQGDPMFRQAIRNAQPHSGGRPRVMYVGHPYRGLRQFPLAGLPDVLYWDFQLHVVELLKQLDIDLVCQPHPEGHFAGRRQPIADVAPTSGRRFEELIDDIDVFVFDAPTSTTFAESLCTNKRVVLIDRFYPLNPAVLPHVQARCRIVTGTPDDRNRLRLDPQQLAEAVLGAHTAIDPSYFRQLLAGVD